MDKLLNHIVETMGDIRVTVDEGITVVTHTPKWGDYDSRFIASYTHKNIVIRYFPILHSYLSVPHHEILEAIHHQYKGETLVN